LFDEVNVANATGEVSEIQLSSALSLSYGLTKRTSVGLTIASLAADVDNENSTSTENQLFTNARLSTDVAGVLMSSDLTIDPNGKFAGLVAARTTLGKYELGLSQRLFQNDFRNIGAINIEDADNLTRIATSANLSRPFFRIPSGRVSYETNASYQEDQSGDAAASLGTRIDYQTGGVGLSWSHTQLFDLEDSDSTASGQLAARFAAADYTRWSLISDLSYSDSGDGILQSGSIRAARPLTGRGYLSLNATRDILSATTAYSASWNRQYQAFKLSSSIAGTSSEDISLRFGFELTARRNPNRWLPAISSTGGSSSVAVVVFGDDNQNGKQDPSEPVLEGVRLTRNGLLAGAATDRNGVALLTGLTSNTSVDVGILEADIKDPSLKYNGIERGVLARPGRVPVIEVALQRATDIEGTVTVAGTNPAPNVRMILSPVDGGEPIEINTEYDGYYYLSRVPLGVYEFGPDAEQLESAGLVAQPATRRLVLENLEDFPPPEDFTLFRLADLDPDDDDDGVPDVADAFPLDPAESVDTDADGIGNNADTDDDGDNVSDNDDVFPLDATESVDTDADGIGNNSDEDDDGDGRIDRRDAFPLDRTEQFDTDRDGIGNNRDRDDDGDKVNDAHDLFPLDARESSDADLDGIGDNADTDDDNDTVADALDLCPATNVPEVTVLRKSLRRGRYAVTDAGDDGFFSSTNAASISLAETGGCSCEQILVARKERTESYLARAKNSLNDAINTRVPRLAAALESINGDEQIFGCRKSTIKSWSKKVQ